MKILGSNQAFGFFTAALVCFSSQASGDSFGVGIATFSSPGAYTSATGKVSVPLSATAAPILVITGDAWDREAVGPDSMTFLFSNTLFGMEQNWPIWSTKFDLVEVAVDWGYRVRIMNFQGGYIDAGRKQVTPTIDAKHYNSLPIHTTFQKKFAGGLTPYATVGFGPFGLWNRNDYGRYSSFEAGVDWQFADSWKLTASYNKTHDETSTKGSGNLTMFQYDSTMMIGNIYYTW
ncbi:MAG: hypothetical protein HOP24_03040 [Sideroxydans sp.]|nr:hypothetical protein [Sideroxydans sp.]